MKRIQAILTFLLVFSVSLNAQKVTEEEAIKETINSFFKGMYEADSALIKSVLADQAVFHTIISNPAATDKIVQQPIQEFLNFTAQLQKGDAVEKISFQTILTDGDLAMAWTPYQFYYKNKFSHCGVNAFQLVKNGDAWKIVYIIDTRRKNNCEEVLLP